MAQIITVLDKQLALRGEQYLRPIAWGANWSKIRIGIRYNLYGSQPLYDSVTGLYVGLCRQSVQYNDAAADMAFYTLGTANAIYWYAGDYFLYNQGGSSVCAKVGSNLTKVGVGSNTNSFLGGAANSYLIIFDVTRNGATFDFAGWSVDGSGVIWNASVFDLYIAMAATVPHSLLHARVGTANYAGSGQLDTLWLAWQTTSPVPFCVSEVMMSRFW